MDHGEVIASGVGEIIPADEFYRLDAKYKNEINTMPGFTNISMYPKLWEEAGVPYSELLNLLIG